MVACLASLVVACLASHMELLVAHRELPVVQWVVVAAEVHRELLVVHKEPLVVHRAPEVHRELLVAASPASPLVAAHRQEVEEV